MGRINEKIKVGNHNFGLFFDIEQRSLDAEYR